MKRNLTFLVMLILILAMLAGCARTATPPASETTAAASSSAPESSAPASSQASDFNESSALNLAWTSIVGTDSVLECPWADLLSLYEDMVFNTLVKLEPDGKTIVPALAKAMDVSPDGKTYTFTLADNVKWHDGTPFSAEDVLFSYNTSLKVPESIFTPHLSLIQGAQDVVDKKAETASGIKAEGNKVVFTLTAPDNSIVLTAMAKLCILPKHLLKDVDPALLTKHEAFWKKPIGTGAYKIDEVSFPNFFSVVRNEDYFGVKPKIRKAVFKSYDTGGVESINADMIAGKLDYVFGMLVNDINNAKNIVSQNKDVKMMIVPATYQRQLWFNNVGSADKKYNSDMQKVEVRQAFNLLIDKESVANFYKGQAVPLSTCVNPALPAYNTSIPLFQRDVAKAKEMLAAAGFNFNRPVRLLYYYDDPTTADIMELLKQNFAEAGVKLEPFLATGDLASIIYEVKNWDIMYAGSGMPDPILTYQTIVPDKGICDGLFGDVEFRQNTFGTLLNAYKASVDPAEMKKYGDQIQLEASKYCMLIPVYGMNKVCMYNSAKLKLDETIFNFDLEGVRDNKFDKWELLK